MPLWVVRTRILLSGSFTTARAIAGTKRKPELLCKAIRLSRWIDTCTHVRYSLSMVYRLGTERVESRCLRHHFSLKRTQQVQCFTLQMKTLFLLCECWWKTIEVIFNFMIIIGMDIQKIYSMKIYLSSIELWKKLRLYWRNRIAYDRW